jgi:protease-4
MRSFGVDAEIIRRGDYKSAGDKFRTEHLDDAVRLQYESYIAAVMKILKEKILTGCKKTDEELDALLEGRVLTAENALEDDWVDEISTLGELENRWKEEKVREVKLKKDVQYVKRGFSLNRGRIAVLVFEGAVIDGHSRRDPLLGQAVGAASFIPSVRKLRDDKKVKAVVFRINSGGGSAFASEDITKELRELSKKKPVIVSMSEVAGSGGYWMSCCGNRTFAMPTTLTGSIGVISIYLSWYKLLDRFGITHDTIKEGEFADTGSPLRKLDPKERRMIDSEITSMYDKFLQVVSGFRDISREEVDSLGRGRVWSGSDAAANGLVDSSGGLADALRAAEEAAGLKKPLIRFYPEIKRGIIEKILMRKPGEGEETADALLALLKGFSNTAVGPGAIMEEVLFRWK